MSYQGGRNGQKDHVMNPNEVLCVVRLKGQTDFLFPKICIRIFVK